MDTGNLKNNHVFYDGYEDEPEITLALEEAPEYSIHLWDGYFDDIFGNPVLDGNGWKGFTRDLHQMEGIFCTDAVASSIDIPEYLEDMLSCKNKHFRYEESAAALALMIDFLQYAAANHDTVIAELA